MRWEAWVIILICAVLVSGIVGSEFALNSVEPVIIERNNTIIVPEIQFVQVNHTTNTVCVPNVCTCECNKRLDGEGISSYTIHGCLGEGCWYENMSNSSPGFT